MKGFTHEKTDVNREGRDEWYTPRWLFEALGDPMFDLDPCAAPEEARRAGIAHVRARDYLTADTPAGGGCVAVGGLGLAWTTAGTSVKGRTKPAYVFVNPPYGKSLGAWAEKFAAHEGPGLFLAFNRTETDWAQRLFATCAGALFLNRRVAFVDGRKTVEVKGAPGSVVPNPDYGKEGGSPGTGSLIFCQMDAQDRRALELAARNGFGHYQPLHTDNWQPQEG